MSRLRRRALTGVQNAGGRSGAAALRGRESCHGRSSAGSRLQSTILPAAIALLVVSAALVTTACGGDDAPSRTCIPIPGANFSRDPFCVIWDDIFDDEAGFTITVEYDNRPEFFTYNAPSNTEHIFLPPADGPAAGVTLEECLARSGIQVSVVAHLPSGDREIRRSAAHFECASFSPSPAESGEGAGE
jgi:hypothetical protein